MGESGVSGLMASLKSRLGGGRSREGELRRVLEGRVASEQLAELSRHPEEARLSGERRTITCMTVDLAGFAALVERLEPSGAFRFLDELLGSLGELITSAGGTLAGATPSSLMACFGAPLAFAGAAERACQAALAVEGELDRLSQLAQVAAELPAAGSLSAGLGLATGEAMVGAITAEPFAGFTVLGSLPARAALYRRLNGIYGTRVVLCEATTNAAREGFLTREVDRVEVAGSPEVHFLGELVAAEPAPPVERQRVLRYEAGLAAYRRREWVRAERLFSSVAEDFGPDGPSRLFAERSRQQRAQPPPADWDGVAVLPAV